jgi:type II secretion system protein G
MVSTLVHIDCKIYWMKLRCPYCGLIFDKPRGCMCPGCGKAMNIPSHARKRSKKRPHSDSVRFEQAIATGSSIVSGRLRSILASLIVLFLAGAGLLYRSRDTADKLGDLSNRERDRVTMRSLVTLYVALTNFNSDCGRYPSTEEGLSSLISNPGLPEWDGPYIEVLRYDPWQNPYSYSNTAGVIRMQSLGPDGLAGTEDDILSPHFREMPGDRIKKALDDWRAANEGRPEATETEGSD